MPDEPTRVGPSGEPIDGLESTAPTPPVTPELEDMLRGTVDVTDPDSMAHPNFETGDGVYALEFDLMFRERYVGALEWAGPSQAMSDRVLQNLLAAQARQAAAAMVVTGDVATEPLLDSAESLGAVGPDLAAGSGAMADPGMMADQSWDVAVMAEPAPAHLTEDYAPTPSHLAEEVASTRPAEEAAPAHLVEEGVPAQLVEEGVPTHLTGLPLVGDAIFGAEGYDNVDMPADPAEQLKAVPAGAAHASLAGRAVRAGKGFLSIFEQERRTLSIAATALAALIVVGVARAVVGAMFGPSEGPTTTVVPVALDESAEANDMAYEGDALLAASDTDSAWLVAACSHVELSDGTTLQVVIGESGPETVDPVTVGEFVEIGTASGDELEYPCDIYRLIAQSEGDGSLYAISYADDGVFYLAKPE